MGFLYYFDTFVGAHMQDVLIVILKFISGITLDIIGLFKARYAIFTTFGILAICALLCYILITYY